MSRYVLLVMFGLLVSGGPLLAQPVDPDDLPPAFVLPPPITDNPAGETRELSVGDRWTYESRDEITGEVKATFTNVVTDITKSEISIRLNYVGKPNSGYLTYDRLWNLKDNGTWRATPHDGSGIRLPLQIGKEWSFQTDLVNSSTGTNAKQTGRAKVASKESVTTKAGTFDTFRIDESHAIVGTNDQTKKIQVVQQTWYAPQINRWVKRTFVSKADGHTRESTSIELVEYGHR